MDPVTGNIVLVLCFIVGSGLVILEAFMPGFGVAGVFGIILEIVAIVFAWQFHGTLFALLGTLAVVALVAVAVILSYRSAMKGKISRSALILNDTELPKKTEEGQEALTVYVGREAVAVSAIRPGGSVEIDGKQLNASSSGAFIPQGSRVYVTGVEGDRLIIRPVKA